MKSPLRHVDGLVPGWTIGKRIAALDPVRDNELAAHLGLEVLYGDAFFVHTGYTIAFARQVAVPWIARVIYRGGTGDMMNDVKKRNDDTLVFFGEMLRNGHSSTRARTVIDRMERIHSRFGIKDRDKLYTLASLAFESYRLGLELDIDVYTPHEREAQYHFWRGVGEYMGLDVPPSSAAFFDWTLAYEDECWEYSKAGRALVDQLFLDWRTRWFPDRLASIGDQLLLTVFGERLRRLHRLPEPSRVARPLTRPLLSTYLALQAARPHRLDRSWTDHFTRERGEVNVEAIGYQGQRARGHRVS